MSPVDGLMATSALAGPTPASSRSAVRLQVDVQGELQRLPGTGSSRNSSRSLPSDADRVDDDAGRAAQLLVVPRLQPGQAGDVARPRSCRGRPRSSRR